MADESGKPIEIRGIKSLMLSGQDLFLFLRSLVRATLAFPSGSSRKSRSDLEKTGLRFDYTYSHENLLGARSSILVVLFDDQQIAHLS